MLPRTRLRKRFTHFFIGAKCDRSHLPQFVREMRGLSALGKILTNKKNALERAQSEVEDLAKNLNSTNH
jgi:hypothetical protein